MDGNVVAPVSTASKLAAIDHVENLQAEGDVSSLEFAGPARLANLNVDSFHFRQHEHQRGAARGPERRRRRGRPQEGGAAPGLFPDGRPSHGRRDGLRRHPGKRQEGQRGVRGGDIFAGLRATGGLPNAETALSSEQRVRQEDLRGGGRQSAARGILQGSE